MTWPAIHRIRLAHNKARRRVALRLFAVAVALIALLPAGQPAHAHADTSTTCILTATGPICPPHFPPPALLDLNQELYAATPAQAASLRVLETQAIGAVLTLHGLAPADAEAVKSWGRADAQAELFALLLQAVNAPAAARTTDQQNAVAWLAAVDQRQAIAAAQAAGREYVTWAGLDQSAYQALLNRHASEGDLQSFLSGTPNADAFCNYHAPAPYASAYTAYPPSTNPADCITAYTNPFSFLTSPPTPSYDQLVTWGEADANYPWLSAPDFGKAAHALAAGLGVGIPLAAASYAATVGSLVAASIATEASIDALAVESVVALGGSSAAAGASGAATIGEAVAESVSAEGAGALTVVIAALVTAIVEGIAVTSAAKLPGQLATLITGAETTPLDPAALESISNGASLFSLFVGATLPVPDTRTCDNAASPAGSFTVVAGGVTSIGFNVPCLNATDIPAASATDPTFLVQAKGATTPTTSPTITWKDAAAGTTSTARLSESWFIAQANGATVQTLRLAYTDWAGAEQTAWLVGNPTAGYNFVTLASSSTAVNASTCVADGTCAFGPSIDYVGPDGRDYSASVRAYAPPTGTPSYSTPVEGRLVTFNANGYAPGSAVGAIRYGWEFQQTGCGMGFGAGSSSVTVLCPNWDALAHLSPPRTPDYGVSVAGDTTTRVFPTSGRYLVRLTAIDATGKRAVDTFTVAVGDAPPALALAQACPLATPCDTRTGNVGTSMTLDGAITHVGAQDSELVLVNWGDGSSEDIGSIGPLRILLFGGSPLTLTPGARTRATFPATLSDAHTYATGGVYQATVTVIDQGGGTASQTVVETINNPAPTTSGLALTPPGACSSIVNPLANVIPPAPAVAAIGSSPLVTVTGSGFVPGSTVQWNGAPLATTYLSPCQVTAQVPATDTASATVGAITVANAAPGGGTSNPQVLYIASQGALAGAALATSAGGSAAAVVGGHSNLIGGVGLPGTPGTLSAIASGAGALALAQYNADPLSTTPPAAVNGYFDVFVPAGGSFGSVRVTDCNLGGGSVVYYDDGTTNQWTKVSGQAYDAGSGCVTFTLNSTGAPGLSQLSGLGGTVFGVGVRNAPPAVTDPGPQSVQYGSQVSVPVSASDAEAADKLTLRAGGLPAGLSLRDNGNGTGTISGTVTAPAGPYTATLSATDGYGDSTPVTVPFTITPAPLTITANNKPMTYGGSVPPFDAGYSGLVNGDSSGVVSGLTCGAVDGHGNPVGGSTPAGTYPITCGSGGAANYSITYAAGTLTIAPAPQAVAITSTPPSPAYVGTTYAVAATGGGSGNPVTVTAGPSTVCTSGGANGATIALVGAGTCTVTANQAGAANYSAATSVQQSFAVSYPPLYLTLGLTSSPAGPVTTGSVVTVTGTLANHSAAAEAITLTATLTYVSPSGQHVTVGGSTRAFTLAAGQTVGQPFSFAVNKDTPRGAYTVALTATDTAGDTTSGSAALTVV